MGYKVLLLDKSKFPRDKCCGGFLSAKAQRYLEHWKDDMPVQCTISSIKLFSSKMEYVQRKSPMILGSTIVRKDFDAFIVNKAVLQGTEFYDGITIYKILDDNKKVEIHTSKGLFACKILIGADGALSFTARHLGLIPRFPLYKFGYACSQIIKIDGFESDESILEFYCIPYLGGFGWCFPVKNGFNIGVGASAFSYKKLHDYYNKFTKLVLANKDLPSVSLSPKGAFVPAGGFFRTLCKGRVLLIGDASGGVDPFSGEGLEHAFASAALAVDSIHSQSLENSDMICHYYIERYNKEIMPERRISLLMALASWKKGELFFNLFKHNNNALEIFETIMTQNACYRDIMQKGLRYITIIRNIPSIFKFF